MSTFFVVKDPTSFGADMDAKDMLLEFNSAAAHARYVIGCGLVRYENEHHSIHHSREDAVQDVVRRVEAIGVGVNRILAEVRSR